jgi:hypothetical protein
MALSNNRLYSLPLSSSVPRGVVSLGMDTTHDPLLSQDDTPDVFIAKYKKALRDKPPHPYAEQHISSLLIKMVETLRPLPVDIDARATGSHG